MTYEIPYFHGNTGNKAHEVEHAVQFYNGNSVPDFRNGNTTAFFFQDQLKCERGAYIRQYFTNPASMPLKVNSFKQINADYLKTFKDKDRKPVYDKIP